MGIEKFFVEDARRGFPVVRQVIDLVQWVAEKCTVDPIRRLERETDRLERKRLRSEARAERRGR
jgi:hypothetical protein